MLGDNKQANKWAREDMVTSGNRFIERQYYKVRDWVRRGKIETRYINTKENCADMMTKAVSVEVAGNDGVGDMLSGRKSFPDIPEPDDSLTTSGVSMNEPQESLSA